TDDSQRLLRRYHVRLSLGAGRFCRLEVALRNGVVGVQVLGARVVLVCQVEGIPGLEVIGPQLRVVGAGQIEQGLVLADNLAGLRYNAAHRPADLRDYRRGAEGVES